MYGKGRHHTTQKTKKLRNIQQRNTKHAEAVPKRTGRYDSTTTNKKISGPFPFPPPDKTKQIIPHLHSLRQQLVGIPEPSRGHHRVDGSLVLSRRGLQAGGRPHGAHVSQGPLRLPPELARVYRHVVRLVKHLAKSREKTGAGWGVLVCFC